MPNNFKNLVFEGGGVKGVAYIGALFELENREILQYISRVAGTSAGAITATLVSLNFTINEITKVIASKNFSDFMDDSVGVLFDSIRLIRKFGWHKGKVFHEWIGDLIKRKTDKENLTFRDHHNLSNKNGFPDLYVVGTNLSSKVLMSGHNTGLQYIIMTINKRKLQLSQKIIYKN